MEESLGKEWRELSSREAKKGFIHLFSFSFDSPETPSYLLVGKRKKDDYSFILNIKESK